MQHISLVIVNWNTCGLLLALLRRLGDEPPFAAEIIVVDNNSTDDSVASVRREFPDVKVLTQPRNGGFAYGCNRGLEEARGRWIMLLNTDTDATWQQIRSFVDTAQQSPDAAVFGPRIVDEGGEEQHSAWTRHLPRHALPQALFLDRITRPRPLISATDVDCVSGCVFLIRTEVLQEVGGFDERFFMYFEEADFCERVRRANHHVRWLPNASFVHTGGASADNAALVTFLAFRESCLLYHAAWHGRLATEWVRACMLLGVTLRLGLWCIAAMIGKGRRANLYWHAWTMLLRPGLVAELCRRPRRIATFS